MTAERPTCGGSRLARVRVDVRAHLRRPVPGVPDDVRGALRVPPRAPIAVSTPSARRRASAARSTAEEVHRGQRLAELPDAAVRRAAARHAQVRGGRDGRWPLLPEAVQLRAPARRRRRRQRRRRGQLRRRLHEGIDRPDGRDRAAVAGARVRLDHRPPAVCDRPKRDNCRSGNGGYDESCEMGAWGLPACRGHRNRRQSHPMGLPRPQGRQDLAGRRRAQLPADDERPDDAHGCSRHLHRRRRARSARTDVRGAVAGRLRVGPAPPQELPKCPTTRRASCSSGCRARATTCAAPPTGWCSTSAATWTARRRPRIARLPRGARLCDPSGVQLVVAHTKPRLDGASYVTLLVDRDEVAEGLDDVDDFGMVIDRRSRMQR